jgi:hypothetical protein
MGVTSTTGSAASVEGCARYLEARAESVSEDEEVEVEVLAGVLGCVGLVRGWCRLW